MTVSSATNTSSTTSSRSASSGYSALGQADFLKLLTRR